MAKKSAKQKAQALKNLQKGRGGKKAGAGARKGLAGRAARMNAGMGDTSS